jgi:hypothetical protein
MKATDDSGNAQVGHLSAVTSYRHFLSRRMFNPDLSLDCDYRRHRINMLKMALEMCN